MSGGDARVEGGSGARARADAATAAAFEGRGPDGAVGPEAAPRCMRTTPTGVVPATLTGELLDTLAASGPYTWVDLEAPSDEAVVLIGERLGLHPLAVRASVAFGQQPRLDEFERTALLVAYIPPESGVEDPVELHAFLSERLLVTIHREPLPSLAHVQQRFCRARWIDTPARAAFALGESIAEAYEQSLEQMDTHLDHVEEQLISEPDVALLDEIHRLRKNLRALRRGLLPMHDAFGPLGSGSWLVTVTKDDARYLRHAGADLGRAVHRIEELRDRATNAMDFYLSRVNNRMSQVMERLTLVATVFLPLSFIAGYFGQNFDWLTGRVGSLWAFLVFGVALNLALVAGLLVLFRKRGWVD